jgi:predicted Zn-ribbon and HTH transcriptional regulator
MEPDNYIARHRERCEAILEAYEAAAKVAENCGKRGSQHEFEMAQHIAAAIRALQKRHDTHSVPPAKCPTCGSFPYPMRRDIGDPHPKSGEEKLPDCMMPDGAGPCIGYEQLYAENAKLEKERDELRNKLELGTGGQPQ